MNTIGLVESSQALGMKRGPRTVGAVRARLQDLARVMVGNAPDRPAPVVYSPRVVGYVAITCATALLIGILSVRAPGDGIGLLLVGLVVFVMAIASVRPVKGLDSTYTATGFLTIGVALTLGPVGCLASCAEATGQLIRFRNGWFRYVFNVATLFLSTWAAWAAFTLLLKVPVRGVFWEGLAGLVAGFALHAVNYLVLSGILWCATNRPVRATLRESLATLPYNLIYGYAALGFVAIHDRFGALGFTFALAPVAALQAFLIMFVNRVDAHERQRDLLMDRLYEKSIQLERSYDATLVALTHALDARDKETEGHSRRVVEYTRLIALKLHIGGDELTLLCHGALLHDIGKIGVPDAILHKPGKLTEEEWQIMRRHPEIGALMVEEVDYLAEARRIILHHHERWDGNGYPLGLRGTQIALGARAFSVADTVDAITQDRPYRRGSSFDVAREELVRNRGTQFDPDAVDAFLSLSQDDLRRIAAIRARVSVDLLADPSRVSARPAKQIEAIRG